MVPLQVQALLQQVRCLKQTEGNLRQRIAELQTQASQSPSAGQRGGQAKPSMTRVPQPGQLAAQQAALAAGQGRAPSPLTLPPAVATLHCTNEPVQQSRSEAPVPCHGHLCAVRGVCSRLRTTDPAPDGCHAQHICNTDSPANCSCASGWPAAAYAAARRHQMPAAAGAEGAGCRHIKAAQAAQS